MAKKKQLVRTPFSSTGEYVAIRNFVFHGHKFAPGDVFNWKQLSCSVQQLHRLYRAMLINVKDDDFVPEVEEPKEVEEPEVEEEVDEVEDEETTDKVIFDPAVHIIDNPARGEWYIMKGAEKILRVTAKEAKRLEKKKKPAEVNMDRVVTED